MRNPGARTSDDGACLAGCDVHGTNSCAPPRSRFRKHQRLATVDEEGVAGSLEHRGAEAMPAAAAESARTASSRYARASFSRRSSPFAQRRRCTRRPASIVEKRSAKFGSISVKIEQDYKRPPRSSSKRPFWAAREGVVAPEDGRRKRSTMTDSERDRIPPLEVFWQNFDEASAIAER